MSLRCPMATLLVATLAFSPRAIRVHAERDRTMLPRRGLVSLAEAPANPKTALPPSLAEALAADDSLADAQLTCVLLATAGACAEVSKALRVLSLAPASAQAAGGALNVQGETQKAGAVPANPDPTPTPTHTPIPTPAPSSTPTRTPTPTLGRAWTCSLTSSSSRR